MRNSPVPLHALASLIRSKNAGPFVLTFDIMFDTPAAYERVKRSGALDAAVFASRFGCAPETVAFYVCDNALAFKISVPRPRPQGDPADADLHGGQQFAPLLDIEIP
ncbi:DUF4387 domain-containing protein [Roseomonas sp. OT10]|uniref:DUF4387 domain-containing protein n=1 Tax=Roseomonas cutis TaxID=2897332 RepID=UPI001E2B2864|nr:DUF4387 domain-containing protein [Roseomonas sp. OT10]UFN50861.1 DUF4387 domain-containing protein [Roseomonas sp. OT10]